MLSLHVVIKIIINYSDGQLKKAVEHPLGASDGLDVSSSRWKPLDHNRSLQVSSVR